jgi:hypothetical protein
MLITGAGGFAGYHLIAAGLASDSGVFVAASPASMIKRASGMTRKKNSLQYDAVNAGCAKDLAFATVSGAKNGDSPVAQVASKIVKALISNVTNRQYQMSDDNIYDQSVPAEDMNKQYINKITLPVNKIHYLKNK